MEDLAQKTIEHATGLGAQFADLRIEDSQGTNIVVMDGKTKTVTARLSKGCGVRAFVGGAWGFSVTNDLSLKSLQLAAESAVRMAKVAESRATIKFEIESGKAEHATEVYRCDERPGEIPVEEKVGFVMDLDKSMKSLNPKITSTNARYDDFEGIRIVANSFGTLLRTEDTWTLGACSAWAKDGEVIQRGHHSVGSVGGYELMRKEDSIAIGRTAAEQALRLLDSKPTPAGKFTCILDNVMTGLLAHEAFGHACEADAILQGASVLEGRIGEKVASDEISLIDDPRVEGSFGYFSYDWEGVPSSKHVLIENGILKGFLHNLETSSRMGIPPNGSARSENYGSPPIIRMSNTYIAGGDWDREELIRDTPDGLLIKGAQYGYVEPSKGQFMFKCDEAYEIVKGELGQRYRDASLSGVILEVLGHVSGLANDFKMTDPGYCGKNGQSARTTDGGPHMRIDEVVVGGLT